MSAVEASVEGPPPDVHLAPASSVNFTTSNDSSHSFMSRFHSQQHKPDPAFAGKASFSIGPLDVHAGSLVRHFRVRQKFDLSDRLSASAGLFYDLHSSQLGPLATLTYKLEPQNPKSKSRIELSTLDRRLLVRKGWEVTIKKATVGVSAEARLTLRDETDSAAVSGAASSSRSRSSLSLRPDLHISLDHVKPLQYELIGIGLVLLLGLPLKLNNKEVEAGLPWGLGRLKAFGRASLKRTGYTSCKLGCGEAAGVLDL